MSPTATKATAPKKEGVRSGWCNRYTKAIDQRHEICIQEGCACECHERWAVIFIGWDGEPVLSEGWRSREDVGLFLDTLRGAGLMPPDTATDVVEYHAGSSPW